jgi:hypothetical protein
MVDLQQLQVMRLTHWHQTPSTRVPDSAATAQLIGQVGIATLFPASSEIPNLFHAYAGDPNARPESEWDSPAGEVYGWRWELGRGQAAFYTAIVRNRPTWVSWDLLPALLELCGDLRTPEEIYQAGELSDNALRIAQALQEAGGVLSTGELRRIAGFPTGKPQRAAYLKAIEELDTRLLLAKAFSEDDLDMRHALVAMRYPQHVARAQELSRAAALQQFLLTYLPHAVYIIPTVLAKHLRLNEAELRAAAAALVQQGQAISTKLAGYKGEGYIWSAEAE